MVAKTKRLPFDWLDRITKLASGQNLFGRASFTHFSLAECEVLRTFVEDVLAAHARRATPLKDVYVLIDRDSHRDDIVKTYRREIVALADAAEAVLEHHAGRRSVEDKLTDEMKSRGTIFYTTIGDEDVYSVEVVKRSLQ